MQKQILKIVALLPMKAHSERVKNKNFREFCGKPLYQWMLDKLVTMREIDMVVINTDAHEILHSFGTKSDGRILLRERKKELCGDFVSMNNIIEDDIANIRSEIYVMTHTTNPLLSTSTIRNALEIFIQKKNSNEIDSLFTVNKFQSRFYKQDCTPINHDPKNLIRTQDLEPWYEENSNLYLFTKDGFESTKARIGTKPMLFETPRNESIDIDDIEGWNLAETIAQTNRNGTNE
ncbi:MAG: acylneuraminate cytidylyltransferase family protein [Ignavibacteria bacterium]|nr:acylneuraminate cytidylyltransferase family protein [Ignavibacteria bacterium]